MLTRQLMVDRWMSHILTHGIFWDNGMLPRGLFVGCHVAPLHWLYWKNFMDSIGVEPMTFGHGEESWQGRATSPPTKVLNTLY
jgi:hypothetical protein